MRPPSRQRGTVASDGNHDERTTGEARDHGPGGGRAHRTHDSRPRGGDGPEARPGRVVQVHYVGAAFASGREFDSSWEQNRPFKFAVGGGQAIKGLDRGVRGMKPGGRREIIVPPRLGYGKQSPSYLIPPGSTLVFVVDLLTVVGP